MFGELLLASMALSLSAGTQDVNYSYHPPCELADAYRPDGLDERLDARAVAARMACETGPTPTRQEVEAALDGERFAVAVDIEAGEILIAARPRSSGTVWSSGAINTELRAIGDDLYAKRLRMEALNEAMLTFYLRPNIQTDTCLGDFQQYHWRAPDAPSMSIGSAELAGAITETTLYSNALGETRRLVIYTPPGHDPSRNDYPAVVMADGGWVHYLSRLVDSWITQEHVEPVVLIGLRSGQQGIVEEVDLGSRVDIRTVDYLPGLMEPHERFDQHLIFAAEEAVEFARTEFGVSEDRNRLAVQGRSSGGGFAFHAGLRRPDVFAHALVHSPGATVPGEVPDATGEIASFEIIAGRYETGFISTARRAHEALNTQGYEATLRELASGHTSEITDVTLKSSLERLFPGPYSPYYEGAD